MHKKVQIVIFRKNSNSFKKIEVLLLKTQGERGSFWQNVTGSVEEGETFHQAATRELFEETQYQGEIFDTQIQDHFIDRKNREVLENIFYIEVPLKTNPTLSHEHVSFEWRESTSISKNDYKYLSNFHAFQKSLKVFKESGNF